MSFPFEALVRAITYQQMSDAAAAKTYKSLQRSLETALTPERVLALPHRHDEGSRPLKIKSTVCPESGRMVQCQFRYGKNLPAM